MPHHLESVRWQKTWLGLIFIGGIVIGGIVIGGIASWLWIDTMHRGTLPTNSIGAHTTAFGPPATTLELEFPAGLSLHPGDEISVLSAESISLAKQFLQAIDNGVVASWKITPVQLERHHETRVWLALVRGGRAVSRLEKHRTGVADFVSRSGAVAGINGGFFVDASVTGTNNTMIGPLLTEASSVFQPERNREILERVQARPLVIWGTQHLAILPFDAEAMNSPELLRAFMPDLKNVFLGGAWIVRHGRAVTESELEQSGPRDANDVRPRVFFGITATSELALGASLTPTSSSNLARAALAAGVQEAVLLDSGYSTSLVYGSRIIAVGRKTALVPSRPVPHAIVVMGVKRSSVVARASSKGGP